MAEKLLELGQNLYIYKVHLDELKEQDVNARSMTKQMFDRLTQTVGRDNRLESLPFVAETQDGLEVVSGHHRTRAARAADVQQIHCIVDASGLTRSQIKAKQLAHNSIAGSDNEQLLQKIYEGIDDVDDRLEAFIDPDALNIQVETVGMDNVDLGLDFRTTLLVFMPYEQDQLERACDQLEKQIGSDVEKLYIADLERFETIKKLMGRVGDEYDVRSIATQVAMMAEIVLQHLGEDDPRQDDERIHLRDLIHSVYIPAEAAEVIGRAIDDLAKKNDLGKRNRWQALEYLAAEYLGGQR